MNMKAGLGQGLIDVATMGIQYLTRSALQKEQQDFLMTRDAALARETEKRDARLGAQTAERDAAARAHTSEEAGKTRTHQTNLQTQSEAAQAARHGQTITVQRQGLIDAKVHRENQLGLDQMRMDIEAGKTQRAAALDERKLGIEERKLGILEANNLLEKEDKATIRAARDAYLKESDPERKADLGAQYMTLLGKAGERWQAIKEKDPVSGEVITTGFIDGLTGRRIGMDGKGGGGGGQPSRDDIEGLRRRGNDPRAAAHFDSVYGQGAAARILGRTAAPASGGQPAPAPAAVPKAEKPKADPMEKYVTPRRGGYVIDAPPRTHWGVLNGRTFPSKEAAIEALRNAGS